eukprot:5830023-Prymnesium_polylepis.1
MQHPACTAPGEAGVTGDEFNETNVFHDTAFATNVFRDTGFTLYRGFADYTTGSAGGTGGSHAAPQAPFQSTDGGDLRRTAHAASPA